MARAGRKRKAGPRYRGGRLKPMPQTYDKGSDHAQLMTALYGSDWCDPIGRAFRTGLLGDGEIAKRRLDASRKLFAIYWRSYSNGSYKCALNDARGQSVAYIDHERDKRAEDWLKEARRRIYGTGNMTAFDQLCVDINPDCGPAWLDVLLKDRGNVRALAKLDDALEALDLIC